MFIILFLPSSLIKMKVKSIARNVLLNSKITINSLLPLLQTISVEWISLHRGSKIEPLQKQNKKNGTPYKRSR